MKKVVVLGAGGKMGYRCSANLRGAPYEVSHVEVSEAGRARLKELGISCAPADSAIPQADVVVLAIPDNVIGKATRQLAKQFKPGAILIALDAAAPFAGELPEREDLTVFVAHPCHPPIFNDETDLEAKRDHFGGVKAKQAIVCALLRGPQEHFDLAEDVATRMYAPVMRSHRATVEQMAILEPVLSETVCATCLTVIREATDEAVRRGVPKEVAHDFILGHLNVELAILFDQLPGVRMSDAANRAVERAKKEIFAPDWKKVFEPDAIRESIRQITDVEA
ncbi:phosphogluconate dehydrogenase C-terminal domain-containing protein [Arenimonas sp.]|uniref:phosphogluconate dehydrogenase C-terminal domain-containing protein n=1 Tax=Arenimonas sp. TaxID=1872635 RepID=UPI002E32D930|nr:phosphogluconate dehydrogenase C-terminal domain-containing protein [Arenimonas sp.]HEX4853706.1 phosphogluconate dehydrogenase C-terminal domain-containing protein [Arenimonas sp.]